MALDAADGIKSIQVTWQHRVATIYVPLPVYKDGNAHVREYIETIFPEDGTVIDWKESA